MSFLFNRITRTQTLINDLSLVYPDKKRGDSSMAKKTTKMDMSSMGMSCPPMKCGPACFFGMLFGAVFAAAGLYMAVMGVMLQWGGAAPMLNVLLWYFGAMVLLCIAKACKMKACMACR